MNERKNLTELKEESKNITYILTVIRTVYFCYIGGVVIFYASILLMPDFFIQILSEPQNNIINLLLVSALNGLCYDRPLTSSGSLNILICTCGAMAQIVMTGFSIFIYQSILKVFKNIQNGETPFTGANASSFKKCYQMYMSLATIIFIASFVIKPLLFLMVSPLLAACFFYSLYLIFEYGSVLQQESDETL